jgi:hypothetical protein
MNRLIQVVITTKMMSLSFNSFAEVRKNYYDSGVQYEWHFKNGELS